MFISYTEIIQNTQWLTGQSKKFNQKEPSAATAKLKKQLYLETLQGRKKKLDHILAKIKNNFMTRTFYISRFCSSKTLFSQRLTSCRCYAFLLKKVKVFLFFGFQLKQALSLKSNKAKIIIIST